MNLALPNLPGPLSLLRRQPSGVCATASPSVRSGRVSVAVAGMMRASRVARSFARCSTAAQPRPLRLSASSDSSSAWSHGAQRHSAPSPLQKIFLPSFFRPGPRLAFLAPKIRGRCTRSSNPCREPCPELPTRHLAAVCAFAEPCEKQQRGFSFSSW